MRIFSLGLILITCSLSNFLMASSAPVTRPDPVGDYVHQDQWPSDAAMVEYARKGRLQFMDVIYYLRNNARPFVAKERVYQYIMMLDTLRQIEIDIKFPVFQDSPVQSLGAFLVNSMVKEIDFTTDKQEYILKSFFWAKFEARYEIVQVQTLLLRNKSFNLEELQLFFSTVSKTINYLKEQNEVLFLIDSAAQLQNLIFEDLMEYPVTRDPSTLPELLENLQNTEGIMVILRKAAREIPMLQEDDNVLAFLMLMEQLQERAGQLPSRLDDELKSTFSDLLSQVGVKALEKFFTVEPENYQNMLDSMIPRDILTMYNKIIALDLSSMTESQIKTAAFFADFIFNFLKNNNYPELIPNLKKIYGQLQMLALLKTGNLEGVYELKSKDESIKKPYTMMIARSNIAEVVASIIDPNNKHRASVSFSKYNSENNSIEIASHLDLESTSNPDQPKLYQQIILKKLDDGQFDVSFYDGLDSFNFIGKKIIETPAVQGNKNVKKSLKLLNGVFAAAYSKNTALRLRMIVDSTNQIKNVFDLITCQSMAETVFYMVLPYYYHVEDQNAIEFTDRALSSSSPFRQMRLGYESADQLKGFYTSGSMANYKPMSFTRINSSANQKEICKKLGM